MRREQLRRLGTEAGKKEKSPRLTRFEDSVILKKEIFLEITVGEKVAAEFHEFT